MKTLAIVLLLVGIVVSQDATNSTDEPLYQDDTQNYTETTTDQNQTDVIDYTDVSNQPDGSTETSVDTDSSSEDLQTYNVVVNTTGLDDLFSDAYKLHNNFEDATRQEAGDLVQAIADAYKTTAGKLILNFGQTVTPAVSSWAQVFSNINANPGCDQDCAVQCFDPQSEEYFFFDYQCVQACKCYFLIERVNSTLLGQQVSNFQNDVGRLQQFTDELTQNFVQAVGPAVQAYGEKAATLSSEFNDLVTKLAVNQLGCDQQCVNDCTNSDYISFWEIPQCIEWCQCDQTVLSIGNGRYNYPTLMLYNSYDIQAWQFFKLHK